MKEPKGNREKQISHLQSRIQQLQLEAKAVWKSGGSVLRYERMLSILHRQLQGLMENPQQLR